MATMQKLLFDSQLRLDFLSSEISECGGKLHSSGREIVRV